MIAASRPTPAMTRKRCSSGTACWPDGSTDSRPTSMRTFWPVRATTRAFSMESNGRSRLRASRFPVPPGSGASGVSVPTNAVATARTVPSPPSGHTTTAPASTACRAWPVPGSVMVVSSQIGSPQPCARQVAVTRARTALEIGELRRVDDDPGPPQRCRVVVGPLRSEVVPVRPTPSPGDARGLQDDIAPRHDHGDDDRDDDDRDDDPERRAVEHSQTLAGAEVPCPGSRFER